MNMKRLVLLALLVALVGGTAFAQQDMGNAGTAGATYLSGVLESIDSSSLTLRDDTDQLVTFQIVAGTVGAKNLAVGTRIRVNFHRNDKDVSIADTIQGAHGMAETTAVATAQVQSPATYTDSIPTPAPTAKVTVTTPKRTATVAVITPESEYVPEAHIDSKPNMAASLPRTASPLAAVALLGLLSLGGALAIRFGN